MANYKVILTEIEYYIINVEAGNKEEAMNAAIGILDTCDNKEDYHDETSCPNATIEVCND